MKKTVLSYEDTHAFPALFRAYLSEDEKLKDFYRYPFSPDSFESAAEDLKKQPFDRKVLVEVLRDQNKPSLYPLIETLRESNTFTVCTGHQLSIFAGPLFFVFKIVTVIRLAEELKRKYPAYNFLPVFWMVSEDHDLEEISSVNMYGKNIEWKHGLKGMAGGLDTSSMKKCMEELSAVAGSGKNSEELLTLFTEAYLSGKNLASATRFLLGKLFEEKYILILDPADERLKKKIIPFLREDIFDHVNHRLVDETAARLSRCGYETQVNPREINCFYITGNSRNRIVFEEDRYKITGTDVSFSEKEMDAEISNHPGRFSPNVVMRPLYQQAVLPNIAYVGGPAEIAYWMEYRSMFEHHGIFYPVLVPRVSALWIDSSASALMRKLRINSANLFTGTDMILKKLLAENGFRLGLPEEIEDARRLFSVVSLKAGAVDPTLRASSEAELEKVLKSLKHIEERMTRSAKQQREAEVRQVKKLMEKLFPGNGLQERHDNFIPLYLEYGKAFLNILFENFDPFEGRFVVLEDTGK